MAQPTGYRGGLSKPVDDPVTTDEPPPKLDGDLAAQERARELIGRVVSDRYRIVELLAMGGMGAVYRGEHLLLKKRIAIKILHPGIENLPELVSRFEREAIVGAHLHHPNMAAATDFGKLEDGSFFLVLEYVRGKTLYHVIKKGPVEASRAILIARQIASALGAAHAKGVVHRDVKPRNVMLLEGKLDLVKLIDFGLAKVSVEQLTVTDSLRSSRLEDSERRGRGSDGDRQRSVNNEGDRLTDVGVIFGTIAYLAPEAAFGMDAVDARADLYALGIILYEMLTGKHPFQGADAGELFKHQRYTQPPPLAERNAEVHVPRELEALVMRLLEKDPAARYQTGKELCEALDAVASSSAESPPSLEVLSVDLPSVELAAIASPEGAARALARPAAPPEDAQEAPPSPRAEETAEAEAPGSSGAPASLSEVLGAPQEEEAEEERHTPPPRAARRGAVLLKRRRSPYLVGAILLTLAAGLFLFTRQRTAPPSSVEELANEEPGPALEASANEEPGPALEGEGPTVEAAAPDPSAAPTAGPSAAPPVESAAVASPVPAELVGIDAAGLRAIVIQTARAHAWPTAAGALLVLIDRDPDSFKRSELFDAAREVVVGLEREGDADKAFDAIVNRLGDTGLDLLYEIVEAKGGSRAATRAGELLHKAEVRERESPALRIAIDLRDASCVDKLKLLKRAVKDGDGRALVVLQTLGVACFRKSRELDQAISALRAKLLKQ